MTGLPQAVEISSEEVMEAILPSAMLIVREVQSLLEETPPELVGDVYEDGMMITGGGALIYGFDRLLSKKTKMPVRIAEEPLHCVAQGAGQCLGFIDLMQTEDQGSLNPLTE